LNNYNKCYSLPGIKGKVILVTGGAQGIGKTISLTMARMGAKVAIIDNSEEFGRKTIKEIKDHNQEALFFKGDVCIMSDVESCINNIIEKMGGLHVLINDAGITNNIPFNDLTLDEWKNVINVNLTGTFICSKTAFKHILKSGGGSIIMISSGSSLTGSGGGAHYAASKGGVNSLVRALSRELAPKGIRVNGVAPRYIKTKILSSLYNSEKYTEKVKEIPIGRLGEKEDIANVVAFLASDLSSFITGETILVDGGMTFGRSSEASRIMGYENSNNLNHFKNSISIKK